MENIAQYFRNLLNLPDLKLLPQNINKNSYPAKLVNTYGNKDPNSIIWLYSPSIRYVGVLIKNEMLQYDEVVTWVVRRKKHAGTKTITGKEYTYLPF